MLLLSSRLFSAFTLMSTNDFQNENILYIGFNENTTRELMVFKELFPYQLYQ